MLRRQDLTVYAEAVGSGLVQGGTLLNDAKALMKEIAVPRVENVPVWELRVDDGNPNVMSVEQLARLKKSIQTWGFIVPIITNNDLVIADGGHRLIAAKQLGLGEVSVIRLTVEEFDRNRLTKIETNLVSLQTG